MERRLTEAAGAEFLRHYAATGNICKAARMVGVHHATFYKRRRRDPVFAAAWAAASETARAVVRQAALKFDEDVRPYRPVLLSRAFVFVPGRRGGPTENTFARLSQTQLERLWALAAETEYPGDEEDDFTGKNGEEGKTRWTDRYLAYRIADAFVLIEDDVAHEITPGLGPGTAIHKVATTPDQAPDMDRAALSRLAFAEWLLSPHGQRAMAARDHDDGVDWGDT